MSPSTVVGRNKLLTRRRLLIGLAITGSALAACSTPAASPTEAPQKAAPTTAPAKTDSAPATSSPAASKPAAASAGKPGWEDEWKRVLEAGQKEGRVVIAGPFGTLYRDAVMEFNKKYPDIVIEFSGGNGRDQGPKILAERDGGQYLWDVHIGGAGTMVSVLKPNKVLDPLKDYLILPEVTDDSKWNNGFDEGFKDIEKQFVYGFAAVLSPNVYVNREFVPESELNSVEQLLDPKWNGKMTWNDPRGNGAGSVAAGLFYYLKGEEWLAKLYNNGVVPISDLRQQVEFMVRNRYPIGIGANDVNVTEFQRQGIGLEIKALAPDTELGSRITGGFGSLSVLNRPPHPNATKVFVNWFLSPDGQESWARNVEQNSRRLDVWGPPETAPKPGVKYVDIQMEENQHNQQNAIALAKRILK